MTDAELGELIEGVASNEGIELEVFVRTAAVDSLMVTLYSTDASKIREEFVAPRPEPGEAREEFIGTVREHSAPSPVCILRRPGRGPFPSHASPSGGLTPGGTLRRLARRKKWL